jgi:OOP family OmpA-OmpF porin
MKKRMFAKISGGADATPNLVATEADAHRIENNKPTKIFFTIRTDNKAKLRHAFQHGRLFFIFLSMNYKNRLKWWLTGVTLAALATPLMAQNQWTYDFNKGLLPIEANGIALKPLGASGKFIKEVVPGSGTKGVPEITRTVYKFENNTGLQFNNAQAGGFLNKSFTVEMYFKLDTLGSWKRVLDFKNRKSDYGSYIFDGKLNFYDYAIGEKAPVRARQYIHYVLSRDIETKMIKMYVNGQSKLEFKDPGTEAMLDQDQVLNFFQDDLIANHEASSGSVALIRLYDRVMTPVFIRRSYQTISKINHAPEEIEEKIPEEPVALPENAPVPKGRFVKVTGKVYDGATLSPAEADVSVRQSHNDSLVLTTKARNGTYTVQLQPDHAYRIFVEATGFEPRVISVQTKKQAHEVKSLIKLTREKFNTPLVDIFFDQSDETLDQRAKASLDTVAAFFNKRQDLKIVLKGHTDNLGKFDKNLELSGLRVSSVKNYLLGKGIPPERIDGAGYGSARPSQFNLSEEQRRRNRRVEIWAEAIKR